VYIYIYIYIYLRDLVDAELVLAEIINARTHASARARESI